MRPHTVRWLAAAVLAWAGTAMAQPANDACANATVLGSLPFTEMVDTSTATNDGDASAGAVTCANLPNSIWYRYTAGASDIILVVDAWEGSTYEFSRTAVYTGTCGALVPGDFFENIFVNRGRNLAHRVPAGTSVLFCVGIEGTTPAGGPIQVQIFEAPEFEVDVTGYRAEDDEHAVGGGPDAKFFVTFIGAYGTELRGRLYHASGTPLGPQLVLDDDDSFYQDVAARGPHGFVVVWEDAGTQVQLIDAAGLPVGTPFTAGGGFEACVDADADGNFVVAWDGPTFRLFDANGTALGPQQIVGGGSYVDVARDDAGNFVIVWETTGADVKAQRFDAAGAPVGAPLTVSSDGYSYDPSVAAAPTGEFLVVWEGYDNGVFGQAFDASGAPDGPTVEISKPDSDYTNHRAHVEADANGNFVVVWEDDGGRTDYNFDIDVTARRLGPGGTLLGPEIVVNTVNAGNQYRPALGVAPGGEFMIAWGDNAGPHPWSVPSPEATIARGFGADGGPPPPSPVVECPPTTATGCRATIQPGSSKLLVRNDGIHPEDLVVNWKLAKSAATAVSAFGNPLATDDLYFCLYDDGGALVTQAALPAAGLCDGVPCWKGLGKPPGAKGFKYNDPERTPNGVLKAVLKAGEDGKAKVIVKAGLANLATGPAGGPPVVPITGSLTAQLHAPATGACWGATFEAATAKRNSGGIFQASGD